MTRCIVQFWEYTRKYDQSRVPAHSALCKHVWVGDILHHICKKREVPCPQLSDQSSLVFSSDLQPVGSNSGWVGGWGRGGGFILNLSNEHLILLVTIRNAEYKHYQSPASNTLYLEEIL
jgi:hypothetical protein